MALYAFDGTGQRDDQPELENTGDTNVARFFFAYRPSDLRPADRRPAQPLSARRRQCRAVPRRALGGITGFGGRTFIKRALDKLEENIERGDTVIDVVGFSRGAALALDFVNEIAKGKVKLPDGRIPTVRFLGLWDCVPSFGIADQPAQHRLGSRSARQRDAMLPCPGARRASWELPSASAQGARSAAEGSADRGVVSRRALRRRRQRRQRGSAARAGQHRAELDVRQRSGRAGCSSIPPSWRRTRRSPGPRRRCSTTSTRSRRRSGACETPTSSTRRSRAAQTATTPLRPVRCFGRRRAARHVRCAARPRRRVSGGSRAWPQIPPACNTIAAGAVCGQPGLLHRTGASGIPTVLSTRCARPSPARRWPWPGVPCRAARARQLA